ncbi:MAG: hypothetical protein IT209_05310 [Armatimonadetes bacterium]|nr:hypothetical protein [Armatimonadota bacterium]
MNRRQDISASGQRHSTNKKARQLLAGNSDKHLTKGEKIVGFQPYIRQKRTASSQGLVHRDKKNRLRKMRKADSQTL